MCFFVKYLLYPLQEIFIMSKKKAVVLTGPGISAESGLQNFRGLIGLWGSSQASRRVTDTLNYKIS